MHAILCDLDVVTNTFRSTGINLLHYNIDLKHSEKETTFVKMGKSLGSSKPASLLAYWTAKQAEKAVQLSAAQKQNRLLNTDGIRVLLVAHAYNLYDQYIGALVISALKSMSVVPVFARDADPKTAAARSAQLTGTLPWIHSKELLGVIAMWRERVDGIIISTFPCGPDSMTGEIVIRRITDKPVLV